MMERRSQLTIDYVRQREAVRQEDHRVQNTQFELAACKTEATSPRCSAMTASSAD